jgi:hypothetical protein
MNAMLLLSVLLALEGLVLVFVGSKGRAGALGVFAVAAGTAASAGLMPDLLTAACLVFAVLSVWQAIRQRNTP